MDREGIGASEARSLLLADDAERRKWSQHLFGMDPWDASLYDLVIHIHKLRVDDAVDFIVHAAGRPCFASTPRPSARWTTWPWPAASRRPWWRTNASMWGVTSEFGNVVIYVTAGGRHSHTWTRN